MITVEIFMKVEWKTPQKTKMEPLDPKSEMESHSNHPPSIL